jgi:hypothetical protein
MSFQVPKKNFWRKRCPCLFPIGPDNSIGNWWECWKLVHIDQRVNIQETAEFGINKECIQICAWRQHTGLHCCIIGEAICAAETDPSDGMTSLFFQLGSMWRLSTSNYKNLAEKYILGFLRRSSSICHTCLKLYYHWLSLFLQNKILATHLNFFQLINTATWSVLLQALLKSF